MRPLSLRITFEIILGAVLASSLFVVLREARQLAEYRRQQETDAQSLRLLREALRQKEVQKVPSPPTEEVPPGLEQAVAKREAVIAQLNRELAEAHATIADLQSQLAGVNDQHAQALASAEERVQKLQADSQARIADLQNQLDAATTESQIARQRASALEAEISKLRGENAASTARASDFSQTVASLQDLTRRREMYMTSILRRYRDITSEFRNMSSVLDTSRDPNSNVCSGATLSRIQNAVSSAEDDLQQLNDLNARAQKLEKQLEKK
jgi:chromosome segregation ATPase